MATGTYARHGPNPPIHDNGDADLRDKATGTYARHGPNPQWCIIDFNYVTLAHSGHSLQTTVDSCEPTKCHDVPCRRELQTCLSMSLVCWNVTGTTK